MAFRDSLSLMLLFQLVAIFVVARIAFACLQRVLSHVFSSNRLPYPPGPPSKSILLGNMGDIPNTQPWITYAKWGKVYGDIIHFRSLGQHTIILNSIEVIKDLIEKRPRIYSDRPHVPMVNLMEWDFATGFMSYGPEWRIHRRLFNQMFRPAATANYKAVQTQKINDLLYALLSSPEEFRDHCKTMPGAIIMSAMYGYDIAPKDDYFVSLAETAVKQISESVFPGAIIVNALPILRHVPSWLPGAGFKRFAEEAKEVTRQLINVPFEFARKSMMERDATPCIVSDLLTRLDESFLEENMQTLKNMAATAYAAAADTTSSSISTFLYAMAIYPDVQKKAQTEIDAVIASGRLVTSDDRVSLPYVEAIYREVMRWQPVTPLGVPHSTSEDDIYKEFYIPKGATVFANIWALSHNPEKYKDPEVFDPDRHFDSSGRLLADADIYAYGFGRRICPGRYLASSTLWLTIAAVLSTFKIERKKDAAGVYVPLNVEYTDALISHPSPFECSISPRSQEAVQLIEGAFGNQSRFREDKSYNANNLAYEPLVEGQDIN